MLFRNAKPLTAALTLCVSSLCAAAEPYQLAVQVERNGQVIMNTTADVALGDTADVEQDVISSKFDTGARIIARVERDNNEYVSDNNEYLIVHLMYLESYQSVWQVLAEPTVTLATGSEGWGIFSARAIDGQTSEYRISVSVTSPDAASISQ